jgi:nucleoside-diphosphate-sugar epimerase
MPDASLGAGPVLVTGAGGFLGAALCRHLLARGVEVHGIVRERPAPDGVRARRLDLVDVESWRSVFAEIDPEIVFHLAAPVDLSRAPEAWDALRPGILDVSSEVARACLRSGARLVAVGTCEEYGDGPAPFREDQIPRPVSAYSALKAAATLWLTALHRLHGLRVTVARPFLCYGPGQSPGRLVPLAIQRALRGEPLDCTDGRQTREWNHVEDVVRDLTLCAAPGLEGRVLNLGGGPEQTVADVIHAIFALCGANPRLVRLGALPRRPGEVARFVGDHTLAERLIGARPRRSLEEGLRETVEAARREMSR